MINKRSLVINSIHSGQLQFSYNITYLFTKQGTLMRRLVVLSLPPSVSIPCLSPYSQKKSYNFLKINIFNWVPYW
jgi:hypothetical protein